LRRYFHRADATSRATGVVVGGDRSVANQWSTIFGEHRRMPDDPATRLALRHADQVRTDFAIIETEIEAIQARLARVPTRGDLALTALRIIFCTAVVTTLFVWWLTTH
jgi:hypothetical protein